jgi:hypothetical protein
VEREEPEETSWPTVIEGMEPEEPSAANVTEEKQGEAVQPPPEEPVA